MTQLLSSFEGNYLVGLNKTAYFCPKLSKSVSELVQSTKSQEKQNGGKKTNDDLNEIQAVALFQSKSESSELWCAVTRGDKTLEIYMVKENETRSKVSCSLFYNTPKRVGHLCFANLPDSDQLCLISGDLAGDAYAYNLTKKGRRLLLGHTASMLTGVSVLGSRLLTADRDEKIRVSSFPETYVTEGYLLGHEAYISSMDTVTLKDGSQLVASCGGDGALRLWDIEALQPLSELSLRSENKELIPSNVAIHPEGKIITVLFDSSKRMDVYAIESGDSGKPKLGSLMQTVDCAATPLSVVFQGSDSLLVLMKEPEYLVCFQLTDGKLKPQRDATNNIREVASNANITMPDTTLERDSYGNIKLRKLNETRGPSGDDVPWNRIERVDIARERQKRHKKRKMEKKEAQRKETQTS